MEVFPERIRRLWNVCEPRVLVLLSLCLQIILIIFGNRRKFSSKNWVRIVLWCAYLTADWAATVALGIISNQVDDSTDKIGFDDDRNNQLLSFWAPILLLHLGGPDTITAYSLEDNQLWLRHFLGLVIQVGFAAYIFIVSWKGNWLSFLTIPMFVAGIIKYGERILVLRSACKEQTKDSILGLSDFSHHGKESSPPHKPSSSDVDSSSSIEIAHNIVLDSYQFFKIFKCLSADLAIGSQSKEMKESKNFFQECSWTEAFKMVEIELGFMYDVLYTKASIIYSRLGCILRAISFSSTICVLLMFLMMTIEKQHGGHVKINTIITFILLIVAVFLEIYSLILLLSSDWAITWLVEHQKCKHIFNAIYSCLTDPHHLLRPRWSNSMGQYNLLDACFKVKRPMLFSKIQRVFGIDQILEKYHYMTYEKVPDELKEFVFGQLKERLNHERAVKFTGDWVLGKYKCCEQLRWSMEVEFDHCILLWHIATDICYYGELLEDTTDPKRQISKFVSCYMFYLLVMCPFMLPVGMGDIKFNAESIEFFRKWGYLRKRDACIELKRSRNKHRVRQEATSNNVLLDACYLANFLSQRENKWEIMSEVWVELLFAAASHCRGSCHTKQLRKGGELLTHIWLMMAHVGMTDHYQLSIIF